MSIITWLTFQSILKLQNFFQMKDLGLHKNQQIMMIIIIACYHEFDSKNWRKFKLKFEYILKKTSIHPPTQTHLSIRRIFLAKKKKIWHQQRRSNRVCICFNHISSYSTWQKWKSKNIFNAMKKYKWNKIFSKIRIKTTNFNNNQNHLKTNREWEKELCSSESLT